MDESWMALGACRILHIDPILYFQQRGMGRDAISALPKRVCQTCHVKDECLNYAIQNNIKDGIWGGQTTRERRKTKRKTILDSG